MQDVFRGIDIFYYNKEVAPEHFTVQEARAEYARLAAVANKRLARMKQSMYADTKTAQREYFNPTAISFDSKNAKQIFAQLQNVARFVNKKSSSITGQRRMELAQLETMRGLGYDWLNKGNIHQFRLFWDEVRSHATNKFKDSEDVVQLFKNAREKRIDPLDLAKDFQFWIEHQQELSTMKRSTETITSAEARERLGLSDDT